MKILLVMDQFDDANNGTTISARRFADVLRAHGNEVRVLCSGEPGKDRYALKPIRFPPIVEGIIRSQGMRLAMPKNEVLREAIAWADVVHFMMPFFLSRQGLKIAEELGVPHTAAFHVQPENITYTLGLGKNEGVNTAIYHYFKTRFYDRFGHIHCPSEFIAGELQRNGYTAKTHVISNGIAEDFCYRKLPKPKELEGRFVILMIGRLSNEKRQDVLIDAVDFSRYRERIQLFFAGQGPKKKALTERGAKLPHPPIIGFYSTQELRDLIAICDLYVHAADAEIEAISCIEAFASGLVPIIANAEKSATKQFALDERSLFEAGNSRDLAAKIDYWLEHEAERHAMEKAYSEKGKDYNIDACVRKAEAMFEQAIEEARR